MNQILDTLLVALVLAVATGLTLRYLWSMVKPRQGGAAPHCSGCDIHCDLEDLAGSSSLPAYTSEKGPQIPRSPSDPPP